MLPQKNVTAFHRFTKLYIALATLVGAFLFLFLAVYPRPFKQPKLSEFLLDGPISGELEFSHVGLWRGCELSMKSTDFTEASSINVIPAKLEGKFSPWLPSLKGVLYQEAYFHTLDFSECFEAFRDEFPKLDLEAMVFEGNSETLIRVGGVSKFSVPLSHANTLVIFTRIDEQNKVILLKGGD